MDNQQPIPTVVCLGQTIEVKPIVKVKDDPIRFAQRKEKMKERSKAYYDAHREKMKLYHKAYYRIKKEQKLAQQQQLQQQQEIAQLIKDTIQSN